PPSAALVFLMAGPASNVATVGAVHRTFGGRVLAAYLGVVAAGSLGLGLAFDAILPTAAVVAHVHEHTGPVASVAAVVLLLLFVRYATLDLRTWWRSRTPVAPSALELGVEGMTCGGCVRRVDAAVRAVDGVQDVAVSLEEATVRVTGAASLETVREAVRAAGFRPSLSG
ncbi:MAG: cation transporter, partial [Myxococcales bacterium]|nr:cation transporter [Myxococcales bacterium]